MPAEVSESAAAGRAADPAELSWRSLARHGLGTAAGGYTLLVAVIVGYYYAVARVGGDFIDSAFSGTAVLLGIAIPVFAALSWLAERRRRDGDSHPGQRGPG